MVVIVGDSEDGQPNAEDAKVAQRAQKNPKRILDFFFASSA